MTYVFPVAETAANLVTFAEGNTVVVPASANVPVPTGRVVKLNLGKPGGVMLVTIEPISADRPGG